MGACGDTRSPSFVYVLTYHVLPYAGNTWVLYWHMWGGLRTRNIFLQLL